MRRLPRRLVLWGGAAAIASGGFAFMASNAIAGSSLGDGAGTVSGYTVSNIHWTTKTCLSGANCTTGARVIYAVNFTLTSAATTAPANEQPPNANFTVFTTNNAGVQNSPGVTCSTQGWTPGATQSGHGYGTYTCVWFTNQNWYSTSGYTSPPVSTVDHLDVEVHQ